MREIPRLERATSLPDTPALIEGVVDFRGESVPIVDLRKLLGSRWGEHTGDSRIIVRDFDGTTVGLIVDAVTEVVTIAGEDIDRTAESELVAGSRHLSGVARLGDRLIILLQVEEVAADLSGAAVA